MLTARVLLAPHVSTLLVDQRRGHRTEMLEAYAAAARAFEAERPSAIVALTARWEAPGPFLADAGRRHGTLTDYYGFGVEVRYDCQGAPPLAHAIVETARAAGVRAAATTRGVDSGVTVPLHFLAARRLQPVVPVSLARGTPAAHRAWGAALRRALDAWPGRVAFVVGGMLSHNVHAWNLRRDTPRAREFDARVLAALQAGAWDGLARLGRRPHAQAQPEAGLLHLEVLRGLLGADVPGTLYCYEAGPGVGAALVEFLAGQPAPAPARVEAATPPARRDPRLHVPARLERGRPPRPAGAGAANGRRSRPGASNVSRAQRRDPPRASRRTPARGPRVEAGRGPGRRSRPGTRRGPSSGGRRPRARPR